MLRVKEKEKESLDLPRDAIIGEPLEQGRAQDLGFGYSTFFKVQFFWQPKVQIVAHN
jgi:hypothetical protein